MQQDQRFAYVPPVNVIHLVELPFDHIPGFIQTQVFIAFSDIDKSHIIIAVRGSKSPCPAAGFHRRYNADIISPFYLRKLPTDDLFISLIFRLLLFHHRYSY